LTPFCIDLTGIEQSWVDQGTPLIETMKLFDNWLLSKDLLGPNAKSWAFITCGDWDLMTMLPGNCKVLKYERPLYFKQWINIKKIFQDFYKRPNLLGMAGMLNVLKMELKGRHHLGIDDCRNIANIVCRLIQEGCELKLTTVHKPVVVPIVASKPETNPQLCEQIQEILQQIALNEELESFLTKQGKNFDEFVNSNPLRGQFSSRLIQVVRETPNSNYDQLNNNDRKIIINKAGLLVTQLIATRKIIQ